MSPKTNSSKNTDDNDNILINLTQPNHKSNHLEPEKVEIHLIQPQLETRDETMKGIYNYFLILSAINHFPTS